MKSKMSFYNLGLFQQIFRQHGWIGFFYLAGLLFAVPLQMLLITSSTQREDLLTNLDNLLSFSVDVQVMFVFSLPVLAGIFLFRYVQVELSVDMIHSLPIKRETLYFHHVVSGIIMLIVPIWFTALVTLLVIQMNDLNYIFSLTDLLNWGLLLSLLTVFFFSFTVVVGMATGMSIAQGIFTYILLLLPLGLYELITIHLKRFLFGFSINYSSTSTLEKELTPITTFPKLSYNYLSFWEIIIYIVLIFSLLFIGYLFYKRRSLEMATEVFVFPFLRPLFQYGLTFCAMLLGGAYFGNAPDGQNGWLIFGFFSGAVSGYFISEMILKKSWRIFQPKIFIGLAGYTAVIVALFSFIQLDVLGYEKKVPRMDQIERVYFGKGYEMNDNKGNYSTDKLFIQDVHDLHENIIKEKEFLESTKTMPTEPLFIGYIMNNGTEIVREYHVPTKIVEASLRPIIESEDYKKEQLHLYNFNEKIEIITIHPINLYSPISIVDPVEIKELKTILQNEFLSQTYDEMVDTRSPWAHLEFLYASDTIINSRSYEWKKSYLELEAWLDKNGYLEDARVFPEQLESVEVAKAEIPTDIEGHIDPEQGFKSSLKQVKIEDKEEFATALTQFSEYGSQASYFVKMTTKNGVEIYGIYSDETVPDEIASKFK